ncbi:unnamed protein product, partial [Allacma fusca]
WLKVKEPKSEVLDVAELDEAEFLLLRVVQRESFPKKPENFHCGISVELCERGLYRVKTRITRGDEPYSFKYPILLPAKHPLVTILIEKTHRENNHAGVQVIMATLRERFWIIRSRQAVKSVLRTCVRCARFDSKRLEAAPAPLPLDRVRMASAFEVVGVDLAGPMYLKKGQKAWIVLYTCSVYRAIHLELVMTLSTESFLQSLRRFIARRGRPAIIHSDNGTNFLGAANLFDRLDWNKIQGYSAATRIQWKFNPPTAAWWGGWWERMVRMVKQLLRRILGRSTLNYEELITVLCDCEAIINSRPLTYVSEDMADLSPISPSMFIQDVREPGVPDMDLID